MKTAFLSTLKGKIIVAVAGVVLIGAVIGGIFLLRNASYRSIIVDAVEGTVTAKGEKKDGALIKGEHLYSGDAVRVESLSGLTMCADKSKYLYADAETAFKIEASGKSKGKEMKIVMSEGSTLHELKEKLGKNDTYEVDTPNSTMAVRGTTFRVTCYRGNDGYFYTLLEVTEGNVLVRLKTEDGTYTGVEKMFGAGESALIRGNSKLSEFVPGNYKEETWILDYPHLPEDSVERLVVLITEGSLVPESFEHEHVIGNWEIVTEAGCETAGTQVKKCKLCGKVMESEEIAATGHKIGDWVVETEPTCETDGTQVKKCEYCNKVMETEAIKATGHVKSSEWTVVLEAGCETEGRSARLCEICKKELETRTIKATGHKYGKWEVLKASTCTAKGERKHVCETCGKEVTEETRALGHAFSGWTDTVVATCTTAGEHTRKCTRCGLTEKETVAALGHDYSEEVTDVQPGCLTGGSGHTVCSRCGADQPNGGYEIARLGHDWGPEQGGTQMDPNTWYECLRCHKCAYEPTPYQTNLW